MTLKRLTKEECETASKKAFVTLRFPNQGEELTYRRVATDGEWGHYYCAERNEVRVLRLKKTPVPEATFPKPEDWVVGEPYSPESEKP